MTELSQTLNGFHRWMNRSVKRVQVYTWEMAWNLFDTAPLQTFRALPAHRNSAAKVARREIAQIIKRKRLIIKINLPVYNEASGKYST